MVKVFQSNVFLGMKELADKSGKGHAAKIIEILKENHISIENLTFQSYDCAKVMSGEFNGAQKLISDPAEKTVPYIPCQDHRTNTFTDHACNSSVIFAEFFDVLQNVCVCFTGSTKRYKILENKLSELESALR